MTRAADRWDVPDLVLDDLERAIRWHGEGSLAASGFAMRWFDVQGKSPHTRHPRYPSMPATFEEFAKPVSPQDMAAAPAWEFAWQRLIRATVQRLKS